MNIKELKNDDVDWPTTRENMKMYKVKVWAASKGLSLALVRRVLDGHYPYCSPGYYRVIEALSNDGFLAFVSHDARLAA